MLHAINLIAGILTLIGGFLGMGVLYGSYIVQSPDAASYVLGVLATFVFACTIFYAAGRAKKR